MKSETVLVREEETRNIEEEYELEIRKMEELNV